MKSHRESSLPAEVLERTVRPYREENDCVCLRQAECMVDGLVVGIRSYDDQDRLIAEDPLDQEGHFHGQKLWWYDNGQLLSAEPFWKNLPHGTAKQWEPDGRLIGTYTMTHGTGFDIWRQVREDGTVYVSEVYFLREGNHDGYAWWFYENQRLSHECRWHQNLRHGIEREWNEQGRLRRGWPRYWIRDQRVTKRAYLRAVERDSEYTLPPFDPREQSQDRSFPPEIEQAFHDIRS
ncbi:MAG: hypothetical protein GXY55_08440 [Phycisphaerae bacterium]|nr:hypothetical protein [Phycisphaerae bacterium]